MQFHNLAHQIKPDAQAFLGLTRGGRNLGEQLKHPARIEFGQADSFVAHPYPHLCSGTLCREPDPTSRCAELDRVAQQVDEHLLEPYHIALNPVILNPVILNPVTLNPVPSGAGWLEQMDLQFNVTFLKLRAQRVH